MSDTAPGETGWRARSASELVWSQFGEVYVVYHRPSGRTHFLNFATADLLAHVLAKPRSAQHAADELAARQGATGGPDFCAAVAASLRHLEHLGLIERCES